MPQESFNALVLTQENGKTKHAFRSLAIDELPEGDVLVAVEYSSLNYKDGLAVTGKGKVVRRFPMVPGVDLAGVVEVSDSPDYKSGDRVLATGWGIGEAHWGGFAQKARLKSQWLTRVPEGLSNQQAMAIGTAGFTAMLCVMALEEHGVKPAGGPVLVTGAGGGVGSAAVVVLAQRGYEVTASTGRAETHDYLRGLGAHDIIDRATLARAAKPLESETWAGVVDTVGGQTLATSLSQVRYGGAIAACGVAGGPQVDTTVFPFILRNVALLGVDSVMCPRARREQAWSRLRRDLPADKLAAMSSTIKLSDVPTMAEAILKGQVRGRVAIDVDS